MFYKDSNNKPKFRYLDFKTLSALALHMEKGAEKYGFNNWRQASEQDRLLFLEAGMRHLMARFSTELDEETKSDHAISAMANLMMFYGTNP